MKRRGFLSLVWVALRDLFDQNTGFGRFGTKLGYGEVELGGKA
jgi:hypothetical protein